MTLKIFLDIETLPPNESILPVFESKILPHILTKVEIQEFNKKFNGKSNEINNVESKEKCFEKLYRNLALKAEYGRIACIGVILEKNGKVWRKGVFGYEPNSETFHLDEKKTLRGFWKLLSKEFNIGRDLIIGHNIMDFDLPFIYKRSRILKVKPSVQFSFIRYRSQPIYDTMREWALWNLRERSISLSNLAELLNIELAKTEGIDGSRVYDEFLADNHSLIAEYCLQDVEMSRIVYHRLTMNDGITY